MKPKSPYKEPIANLLCFTAGCIFALLFPLPVVAIIGGGILLHLVVTGIVSFTKPKLKKPSTMPEPFHPNCRCTSQEYSLQQSQRDLRQMISRINTEIDQLLVDIHANEGRVNKLLDANDLKRLELGRIKAHRDDLLSSLMIDVSAMDKVIDHVVNAAEGEVK